MKTTLLRACALILLALGSGLIDQEPAEAEIRRHVIGDDTLDTEAMLHDLTALLREDGFSVNPIRVEDVTVTAFDVTFSHTFIEYSYYRSRDNYEIALSLFALHEDNERLHRALVGHVRQQFGHSGIDTIEIDDTAVLLWNEYDHNGQNGRQLLDTTLSLWRDEYISSR